jgi:hypothetical protein
MSLTRQYAVGEINQNYIYFKKLYGSGYLHKKTFNLGWQKIT